MKPPKSNIHAANIVARRRIKSARGRIIIREGFTGDQIRKLPPSDQNKL